MIVFAMDTVMMITAYGEGAAEAVERARAELHRLEDLFSVTYVDSDIARINAANGVPIRVSEETAEILGLALDLWRETGGAFAPGLYTLQRAWGFTTDENRVPEDAEIMERLAQVDLAGVEIDGLTVTVPAGTELDLGAIAKGFAADQLVEIFTEMGVDSALFSLGGDVFAHGGRPDGGTWRVAIRDPLEEELLVVVEVRDQMVSTSGGYERMFVDAEGNVHHHILDPTTGRPAESGLVSVTVISPSGARSDALSTAIFVMGLEAGLAFAEATADVEALFVSADGTLTMTAGFERMLLSFERRLEYS